MPATNAKMDFEAFGVRDIELPRLRPRGRHVKGFIRFGGGRRPEPLIERAEVLGLLFNVSDIAPTLAGIERRARTQTRIRDDGDPRCRL
jgi:hypothetical protein